jgi:hypothetical protein
MTLDPHIAVARLCQLKGQGNYCLGAGNKNPNSTTPFEWKMGYYGCDYISAVLWAYRCPKHHPSFPEYEGDINVDSALMDAGAIAGGKGSQAFFTEIHDPASVRIGDLVAFPSVRAHELNDSTLPAESRCRIGHIGLIAGWRGINQEKPNEAETPWNGNFADFVICECSSGWPAIKFGYDKNFNARKNRTVCIWKGVETVNDKWRSRIVRYIGP